MALIDKTYFIGELDIPDTDNPGVEARLNLFIEKYEEKFLRLLLGGELYTEFIAGIQVDPMATLWSNLLYGSGLFKGVVVLSSGVAASILAAGNMDIVVGRGGVYDPEPGATSVAIPPAYDGRTFKFLQRGFGQLRSDEFSVAGGVLTLGEGWIFNEGDTYFYDAPYSLSLTGESTTKRSIIANYVYYWWMRDRATLSMGVGEGKPQLENANMADSMQKQARAWNEMAEGVHDLYDFLDEGAYNSWTTSYRYGWHNARGFYVRNELAYPINTFNL